MLPCCAASSLLRRTISFCVFPPRLDLGEHVLIIRLVLLHFLDETGRLGALIAQLVVLDRQRLLGALLLGERGLERLLLFRDLRLQHAQVVDHALVASITSLMKSIAPSSSSKLDDWKSTDQ